jgi:hypothetical protein
VALPPRRCGGPPRWGGNNRRGSARRRPDGGRAARSRPTVLGHARHRAGRRPPPDSAPAPDRRRPREGPRVRADRPGGPRPRRGLWVGRSEPRTVLAPPSASSTTSSSSHGGDDPGSGRRGPIHGPSFLPPIASRTPPGTAARPWCARERSVLEPETMPIGRKGHYPTTTSGSHRASDAKAASRSASVL